MTGWVWGWAGKRRNEVWCKTKRRRVWRRLAVVVLGATTLLLAASLVAVVRFGRSSASLPPFVAALAGVTPTPPAQVAELRPDASGSPSPMPTSISTWYNGLATPGLAEEPGATSTPTAYIDFIPSVGMYIPTATHVPEREHKVEPPP